MTISPDIFAYTGKNQLEKYVQVITLILNAEMICFITGMFCLIFFNNISTKLENLKIWGYNSK